MISAEPNFLTRNMWAVTPAWEGCYRIKWGWIWFTVQSLELSKQKRVCICGENRFQGGGALGPRISSVDLKARLIARKPSVARGWAGHSAACSHPSLSQLWGPLRPPKCSLEGCVGCCLSDKTGSSWSRGPCPSLASSTPLLRKSK